MKHIGMLLGVSSSCHLLTLKCFSSLSAKGLCRVMMVCVYYDIYKGCATSLPLVNVHALKKNVLNLQSPPPKLYLFLHHPYSLYFNHGILDYCGCSHHADHFRRCLKVR